MDIAWFKARKREVGIDDVALAAAINRERSVANKIVNGKVAFDVQYVEGFATALRVSREEILRRAGVLDGQRPTLISEEDLAEILAEAQAQIPVGLPYAEYPRALAEAARLRIELLLNDRSKPDSEARQAEPVHEEGAQPPAPTNEAGQA